jgi:ATP-binding cassette subfamily B protein
MTKLMAGRTTLVIAHRFSTIANADRIIVLHKGQIRETGTHQELIDQRGIYWRLYRLQYNAPRSQEGGRVAESQVEEV